MQKATKAITGICGAVLGIAAVVALLYGIALRGGYVIDDAIAGQLIQTAANAEAVQHKAEAVKRELADLSLQRDLKFNRLSFLNATRRTPDQDLEAEILRHDIKRIGDRIAELEQS